MYYSAAEDEQSPFHGREYNLFDYENDIYGYFIHPQWDQIGSETLYLKVLFADYEEGYAILEMFGEWNDAITNDSMHLKRNLVDFMLPEGINKYILICENVFNYHGLDDDYYAEWFEDVEDGWIAAVNLREHVESEWSRYHLDNYINYGGNLDEVENWRTMTPRNFYDYVSSLIMRRLT